MRPWSKAPVMRFSIKPRPMLFESGGSNPERCRRSECPSPMVGPKGGVGLFDLATGKFDDRFASVETPSAFGALCKGLDSCPYGIGGWVAVRDRGSLTRRQKSFHTRPAAKTCRRDCGEVWSFENVRSARRHYLEAYQDGMHYFTFNVR